MGKWGRLGATGGGYACMHSSWSGIWNNDVSEVDRLLLGGRTFAELHSACEGYDTLEPAL